MIDRTRRVLSALMLACGLLGVLASGAIAQGASSVVHADVKGIINPVQADYVARVIEQAEQRGAAAVILRLDTPGGLDSSMRQIIQRILAARVPVIVYVGPPGARAASAGVYIAYAAHVSAMAPNTNIDSATPVMMGEGGESKVSAEMRAKINNDAVASIRTLAQRRGRNADWAEQAVREALNATETDAVQQRIVDLSAPDLPALLRQADGRTVELDSGPLVLRTADAAIETVEMTPLERFLHAISEPTIAYILLSLGSLGLMLELYNPGQVVPGMVGGICLLLAFYALGTLPVNLVALLLIGLAFLLFVVDAFTPTHGALTAGGAIAFVLGSLMLFNSPDGGPILQVSLAAIAAMAALMVAFFVIVVTAVARSRRRKVATGREGLIGQRGVARTRLDPTGFVHVESELWQARSPGRPVEPGEAVRVLSVDKLLLTVEPELPVPLASPQGESVPSAAAPSPVA